MGGYAAVFSAVLPLHSSISCVLLASRFIHAPSPSPSVAHPDPSVIEASFPHLPLSKEEEGGRESFITFVSPPSPSPPLSCPLLLISCIHILAIHSPIQSIRLAGPPAWSPEESAGEESAGCPLGNLTSWNPSTRASGSMISVT